MDNVKIGDTVALVSPSGNRADVVVTDVIRCVFSRKPIAIEFQGKNGLVSLPVEYFQAV